MSYMKSFNVTKTLLLLFNVKSLKSQKTLLFLSDLKSLKSKKNSFSSNHLKITKTLLLLSNLKSFSVCLRMCFTARTINCHFESIRLKKKNFFFVNFFVTRCFSVLAVSRFFTYRCYTHTRL